MLTASVGQVCFCPYQVSDMFWEPRIVLTVWISCRNGLSTDNKKISFAEMMIDDEQISREERWYRLWINSLGISSYVNHMFEDVRSG